MARLPTREASIQAVQPVCTARYTHNALSQCTKGTPRSNVERDSRVAHGTGLLKTQPYLTLLVDSRPAIEQKLDHFDLLGSTGHN